MNGCVLPGTGIAVDFWNIRACPSAKLFFLSHLHGDHVVGLTSSWQHPIHCSEVTARLLQKWYQLPASLLRPLEMDVSHVIPYPDGRLLGETWPVSSVLALHSSVSSANNLLLKNGSQRESDDTEDNHELNSKQAEAGTSLTTSGDSVTVTLIDANHCPGAVMFLFQGSFGTILHTGDFRLSEEMLQHPSLSAVTGKVDKLYLDNTYLHPECEFPSRREAINEIIEVMQQYSDCDIVIGVRNLGKESLLAEIGKALEEDVSITAHMYQVACLLGMADVFCVNDSNCHIRTVPFRSVSNAQLAKWNKVSPTIAILPTAIFTGLKGQPFAKQPSVFIIPYSDHSSYSELMKFVGFIRPRQVIPIVPCSARGPFGADMTSRADVSCFDHLLERSDGQTHKGNVLSAAEGGGGELVAKTMERFRVVEARLQPVDERRKKEVAAFRRHRSLRDARKCSVTKRRQRGIEYDETLLVRKTSSNRKARSTTASCAKIAAVKVSHQNSSPSCVDLKPAKAKALPTSQVEMPLVDVSKPDRGSHSPVFHIANCSAVKASPCDCCPTGLADLKFDAQDLPTSRGETFHAVELDSHRHSHPSVSCSSNRLAGKAIPWDLDSSNCVDLGLSGAHGAVSSQAWVPGVADRGGCGCDGMVSLEASPLNGRTPDDDSCDSVAAADVTSCQGMEGGGGSGGNSGSGGGGGGGGGGGDGNNGSGGGGGSGDGGPMKGTKRWKVHLLSWIYSEDD